MSSGATSARLPAPASARVGRLGRPGPASPGRAAVDRWGATCEVRVPFIEHCGFGARADGCPQGSSGGAGPSLEESGLPAVRRDEMHVLGLENVQLVTSYLRLIVSAGQVVRRTARTGTSRRREGPPGYDTRAVPRMARGSSVYDVTRYRFCGAKTCVLSPRTRTGDGRAAGGRPRRTAGEVTQLGERRRRLVATRASCMSRSGAPSGPR